MNFYIISLLNALLRQNILMFGKLELVQSAIYFDHRILLQQIKRASDFYLNFFQQIAFLPKGTLKEDHFSYFHFDDVNIKNRTVHEAVQALREQTLDKEMLPIHLNYTDLDNLHFVGGFAWTKDKRSGFLLAVDLSLPKKSFRMVPTSITYVKDIFDSYDEKSTESLRDFVNSKGRSYNQFQKDCKEYFGDTFYAFVLKRKMIEAVGDIVFTAKTMKEIAFKNHFPGYLSMYKTFVRYGVSLSEIPRLGYFKQ